jgi:hypothetical protein
MSQNHWNPYLTDEKTDAQDYKGTLKNHLADPGKELGLEHPAWYPAQLVA